jgi:aminoglycoside phosphotransferase (APT) family kinase protein
VLQVVLQPREREGNKRHQMQWAVMDYVEGHEDRSHQMPVNRGRHHNLRRNSQ